MVQGTKELVASLLLVPIVACASPTVFTSRVPYEPLIAQLKASGGDASKVIHVRTVKDLLRLDAGKRYKLALEPNGALTVAPMPANTPHNDYVHPILAGGRAVPTAGGIVVQHAGGTVMKVTLDQDSKAYCPTFESLDEAVRSLKHLGLTAARIVKQDRPATCASQQMN